MLIRITALTAALASCAALVSCAATALGPGEPASELAQQ